MNALSKDLRSRIVQYYTKTPDASYSSTSKHFMVGIATIYRLMRHVRTTGSIEVTQPKVKSRWKIDAEWLGAQLKNGVDKQLKELVADYKRDTNIRVAISTMWYALKSLNISHKKNNFCPRKRIGSGKKPA
jgi:transposase